MVVDGRVVERREGEGWSEERKPFHRVVKKHQVSLTTTGSGPLLPKVAQISQYMALVNHQVRFLEN